MEGFGLPVLVAALQNYFLLCLFPVQDIDPKGYSARQDPFHC